MDSLTLTDVVESSKCVRVLLVQLSPTVCRLASAAHLLDVLDLMSKAPLSSDFHLERDVLEELKFAPKINAARTGGVVTEGEWSSLTGHVSLYAKTYTAERVATP
jgi:hypothetical protein